MPIQAKYARVGFAEAYMAFDGNKVLCDKLVRVRRFASEQAALKAGQKANPSDFH